MMVLAMPLPDIVDVLHVIEPRSLERAKRVKLALEMLQRGMPLCEVRIQIERKFEISRQHAWRVVDMALDMAGPA